MESVKSLKHINILKYFLVILISSTLLAISAKLKIPFYPVPMTMQTFVVLLIGVCFGWKLGGTIGLATLIFAFGIGPAVSAGLYIVSAISKK